MIERIKEKVITSILQRRLVILDRNIDKSISAASRLNSHGGIPLQEQADELSILAEEMMKERDLIQEAIDKNHS